MYYTSKLYSRQKWNTSIFILTWFKQTNVHHGQIFDTHILLYLSNSNYTTIKHHISMSLYMLHLCIYKMTILFDYNLFFMQPLVDNTSHDYYIARTRPGTDFPTRFETLLSQRKQGQWRDRTEPEKPEPFPKRVTVSEVLKYSRTWVMTPSVRVHACTHEIERSWSHPSTKTIDPMAVIDCGVNWNLSDDAVSLPVSKSFMNWWEGGPWYHHSKWEGRREWTVETSREEKAS